MTYSCLICTKTFSSQRALNGHQRAHAQKNVYSCLHCGATTKASHQKKNKFCSNSCCGEYTWQNLSKPKIEAGNAARPDSLKRYLIEIHGNKCFECDQLPEWNGKILVLQLDHIDGNSDNNLPINLRLLCPNCHTQTETFGNKGSGNRYKKVAKRNKYLQQYKSLVP